MSSPISVSASLPSSPPSSSNSNAQADGNANNGKATDNATSGADGNSHGSNGNALSPNSLLLAQVTHALAQGANNGAPTGMPCFGYCLDRGNGQYTRLIPADMLPALVDIPARQQGSAGMMVLPCPTGLAPNGRSSNLERVLVRHSALAPPSGLAMRGGPGQRDSIQSRIDTIVATTPAPIETHRKQKIYCDKWIHEGVCAFTQQGCKYKHEMPLDKDTQESLGLFQGLPAWWRKHQGEVTNDQQHPQRPQHQQRLQRLQHPQHPQRDLLGFRSANTTGGVPRYTRPGPGSGPGANRGANLASNRLTKNTWRSVQGQTSTTTTVGGGDDGGDDDIADGHGQTTTSPQNQTRGGSQYQAVAHFSSPFGPIAPPSAVANAVKREKTEATLKHKAEDAVSAGVQRGAGAGAGIIHNNPWGVLKTESIGDDAEDGVEMN